MAPAACIGASTALPIAGSIGSTTPGAGCLTGRIVNPEVGGQSDPLPYCPDTDGDGIADPPPPPPPTHSEITTTTCPPIPRPAIGHNPRQYGITGLETWLWDTTNPQPVTTTGTIRGYAVSCTLTPTTWTFDTADPYAAQFGHPSTYTTRTAGQEDATTPARHLFEATGTYPLTLTVTWDRTTTAGQDSPTRTTTTDYPVREVRPHATTAPR